MEIRVTPWLSKTESVQIRVYVVDELGGFQSFHGSSSLPSTSFFRFNISPTLRIEMIKREKKRNGKMAFS
ncbi:hypothetical protein TorRG33x02_077840 [Trema orientale]|uniref:Uncharacterized protein n=1 Tax=Trema orientale TaxID=63057 RepID=A0A2P5FFE6_TREOI|nr:hypothetical protein TorRG33x02_077840 [Trema orientale]